MDFRMKFMQNPIKTRILAVFARFRPKDGNVRAGKLVSFAAINYVHDWDEYQHGLERLVYAARAMANLQARCAARKAREGAHGAHHRQPVDSRLSRVEAHGLLPRPRVVVSIQPENSQRISRYHFRAILVDGIRDDSRTVNPQNKDKILAGQHTQRISHALSHRGPREVSRI